MPKRGVGVNHNLVGMAANPFKTDCPGGVRLRLFSAEIFRLALGAAIITKTT